MGVGGGGVGGRGGSYSVFGRVCDFCHSRQRGGGGGSGGGSEWGSFLGPEHGRTRGRGHERVYNLERERERECVFVCGRGFSCDRGRGRGRQRGPYFCRIGSSNRVRGRSVPGRGGSYSVYGCVCDFCHDRECECGGGGGCGGGGEWGSFLEHEHGRYSIRYHERERGC